MVRVIGFVTERTLKNSGAIIAMSKEIQRGNRSQFYFPHQCIYIARISDICHHTDLFAAEIFYWKDASKIIVDSKGLSAPPSLPQAIVVSEAHR